jgi:hypothetical protein
VTTRTSTAEPPWVAPKRVLKAAEFAEALRALRVTADDIAHFTDQDRKDAEKATGFGKRSPETWMLTLSMLAGSAQVDCPYCGHGDPLGAPGPIKRYGHKGACSQ